MKYVLIILAIIITILILVKPETKVMTYNGKVNASELSSNLFVK